MPWRELGPSDFHHLEFVREPDRAPERRRRRNFPAPIPRPADRRQHASAIRSHAQQAVTDLVQTRRNQGVQADRLFVLEFDGLKFDFRDVLEQRFSAHVVDERRERLEQEDRFRLLVQFPDRASVENVEAEARRYADDQPAALLPQALRRDFFDALRDVRGPDRQDRMGLRLATEGYPDRANFYIDVDLWHPGNRADAQAVTREIRNLCERHGGRITDSVHTESLLLLKVEANRALTDRLLDLDVVARIDLPPRVCEAHLRIFRDTDPPQALAVPADDDPILCIVDSGVLSGHPFLANWIIEEEDFGTGEDTATDLNGHGTAVAGIAVVAYPFEPGLPRGSMGVVGKGIG